MAVSAHQKTHTLDARKKCRYSHIVNTSLAVEHYARLKGTRVKAGISPEMAVRLAKAFGSTPEAWLRLQMAYDLAQVRQQKISVQARCAQRSDGRPAPVSFLAA